MPLNVTHTYVSSVADSSAAAAAGKILPQSHWNAPHTVSGTMLAIDVENIPSGIVTATDVQAAINELALAIPSPGPGTDPLFLNVGINVEGFNQTIFPFEHNFSGVVNFTASSDCSLVNPNFSAVGTAGIILNAINGQATYGAVTQAKITFVPLTIIANYNASGQKFLYNNTLNSYGMSDSSIWADNLIQFGGGPVNGDEGQGWGSVSVLSQWSFVPTTTISVVETPAVINTTTTQIIDRDRVAQTVTVVDASSLVDGTWVVVEQAVESNSLNTEAVQVIAHTNTSITGIFRCTHLFGVTVTPALVVHCPSTFQMGQDRFLVNMSQPSYSIGQVSAISGGGMDFSGGPALAANIVGGNATNIGCIALACDDYIGSPFSVGTPLKDWYQIIAVTTPTHLAVNSFSIAGDTSYKGNGTDPANLPTNYIIRPSARVLRISGGPGGVSGQLICETSTSTWTVNDNVVQAMCPYPDVTGFQWDMASFSAGGTYRAFQVIRNTGARTFEICFFIDTWGTINEPTADGLSWGTILQVNAAHNIGILLNGTRTCAIQLTDATATGGVDLGGMIKWATANIRMHSGNGGMYINPANLTDGSPINSDPYTNLLQFFKDGLGTNTGATYQMNWGGSIYLPVVQNHTSSIMMEKDGNAGRWFARWGPPNSLFLMGVEEMSGSGVVPDFGFYSGPTEVFRLASQSFGATPPLKLTAAANFTANGAVATAMTNVGPVGSHTTVQKWLTITDDTGATVYIPCF